jgi:hypothetical protein
MQGTFEKMVDSDRFSMPALAAAVTPEMQAMASYRTALKGLEARLGARSVDLIRGVLRHVFLIELVKKPKIESTKFRVRWFSELDGDPRHCSFKECQEIACKLLDDLERGWLSDPTHDELLRLSIDCSVLPYELPLDYLERPKAGKGRRIHRAGNLCWTSTPEMLEAMRIRKFLTDTSTSPDAGFFKKVLEEKIKVKTYLTDRVLTGTHKTNREKRWEVHPDSVHFADRRTCLAIERCLTRQICSFAGFPPKAQEALQKASILPASLTVFRCPITLDPMSFKQFREQLENPTHGKSDFQVGHLNPLKLDAADATGSGHSPENISWVSADGNRIQGSLGLNEVQSLIRRIAQNYEANR